MAQVEQLTRVGRDGLRSIASFAAAALLALSPLALSGCDAPPPAASGGASRDIAAPLPETDARREAIERAAAAAKSMPIVYNRPNVLPFGEASRFTLVIASADLQTAIRRAGPPQESEEAVVESARLTPRVEAALTGRETDVKIRLLGPQDAVRDLTQAANAVWEWEVIPQRPGQTQITLAIYNLARVEGRDSVIEGPAFTDTFAITTTWPQRVKQWWKVGAAPLLALGAAAAALAAFLTLLRKLLRWREGLRLLKEARPGKLRPTTSAEGEGEDPSAPG